MDTSLTGTTSFNTACLIVLTLERLLFYIISALRACFGSGGDLRVKCQSCCGCFQAKLVSQKEHDGSSMVSEISEAEEDGDNGSRVKWADESEERAKEASD